MNDVYWLFIYINSTRAHARVFYSFDDIEQMTDVDDGDDMIAILAIDESCTVYSIAPNTVYVLVPYDLSDDLLDDK